MLDGLFATPAVTAVDEALTSTRASGKLAVIGNAKLATALAAKKRDVIPVGITPRAAKKLANVLPDLSTIDERSLAAVIGVDVDHDLGDWIRVIRDGGAVVMVDRATGAKAPQAASRALCAGLTEIEQRRAGRVVITSGLVSHL